MKNLEKLRALADTILRDNSVRDLVVNFICEDKLGIRSCGLGLAPSVGGGTGATSGGVGFGTDGLLGDSGVVAMPELKEGRGVRCALQSRVNL